MYKVIFTWRESLANDCHDRVVLSREEKEAPLPPQNHCLIFETGTATHSNASGIENLETLKRLLSDEKIEEE